MLPGAPGANRKPALLLRFRQGASQPHFPASLGLHQRLLPIFASPHKPRSVDPSKIAFVSLAAMANQAQPLRGVTPSRRSKVPGGGRRWFTTGSGACPDIRRSSKPYATPISSRSIFPKSVRPPKPNSVEPPWYGTRMPGGVGGVALRGVPLSRSRANSGRSLLLAADGSSAPKVVPRYRRRPVGGQGDRAPQALIPACALWSA